MTRLPICDAFTEPQEVRRSAYLFLACVLTLLGLGAVMVYSASGTVAAEVAQRRAAGMGISQLQAASVQPLLGHLVKICFGLVLLVAAARTDFRWWERAGGVFYVVAALLLALVLVPGIGAEVNGARRWFRFSFLPFALQPSEIAKIALIIYLSSWISSTADLGRSFRRGFIPGALIVLFPALLILVETDVGTFLLVSMLGFSLLLLAGARLRDLLALGAVALPLLVFAVAHRLSYVVDRFQGFSDPAPGSQLAFALSALKAGGIPGVGLGAGRTKLFFLAEAENDFIFSVIGEELGMIGTTALIMLFAVLMWSGARVLFGVRNRFGFFLVAGILLTIVTQALINLAVATGCVPVKGMPLPFVSSGGSSLTVLCLGVGIILSVARNPDVPVLAISTPSASRAKDTMA